MRSGKRALAGVAAGALAAGLIPFAVVATAATANAASTSATVTPVRATGTGASPLSIPAATAAWSLTGNLNNAVVDLTTAPTAAAIMTFGGAGADDTVTLGQDGTLAGGADIGDDTSITLNVDTAGLYVGVIADGTDTVSFSFTTAGTPASISLSPASQSVPVGGTASFALQLLDANGNRTQPQTVDSVGVAASGAGATVTTPITSTQLADGLHEFAATAVASGATTITATPAGTLPGSGVTAKTATITTTGTISSNSVQSLEVTAPATAENGGAVPNQTASVQAGTTSITVTVDDTTATAVGSTLRLRVVNLSGAVNGSTDDTQYFDVTTNSDRQATLALTLAGGAQTAGNVITVSQVTSANAAVSPARNLAITLTTPTVGPATVVPVPSGSQVAAVGATTPVTVTVDDSFGNPQAGWTLAAQRINVNGAAVAATTTGSGTTGADGSGSVNVSPLGTTTNGQYETYRFVASNPLTAQTVVASATLTVTYTTGGAITSLTVTPSSGDVINAASPTPNVIPAARIASGGDTLTGRVGTAATTGTFNKTTGAATPGTGLSLVTLTTTQVPATSFTVTVPEGLKVSNTAPTATTLFSAGSTSATVSSAGTAYIWGTKTGVHNVTVTAGGITRTAQVLVWNTAADAYNLAISPAAQTLATGAIGTVDFETTDMFGNAVTPPTGAANVGAASISGEALFAGFLANTNVGVTATSGTQTTTVIAAGSAGEATIAAGLDSTVTDAAGSTYTPPAGVDAPVVSAGATITVVAGPTAMSILILDGYRDGQRIETFGESTGFDMGAILKPWIRFPGQTGFSIGTANILVDDMGDWNWGRNTNKRTAVQIRDMDNTVRSNTVIIPAR